jgi:hypothetical protein
MLDSFLIKSMFFFSNLQDIGRMHAASIPLLRTIFQVRFWIKYNDALIIE